MLGYSGNKKTVQEKKTKAITVIKKEGGGGGPARYDHDHRFNGFFTPSLSFIRNVDKKKKYTIGNNVFICNN